MISIAPFTHFARSPVVSALIVCGLLSACAVSPDYQRPEVLLPPEFKAQIQAQAQPEATQMLTVNPAWWTLFNDPVLNGLIDLALTHNADVRLAVARVGQAEAAAREAGASLFPSVDAQTNSSGTYLSEKTATWSPASPEILRSQRAALNLSYEVDVWKRLQRGSESANASLLANRYAHETVRQSVVSLVASTYLRLRALDAQQAITAASLLSREESVKLVKAQVKAGLVSPLDQYQAEGALAALEIQASSIRRNRALTNHQLALMTGKPELDLQALDKAQSPVEKTWLVQLPIPPIPPAGLPAQLIENRPDVQAAEQRLMSAQANIGVAKAAYYPRFSLTGSTGAESKTLATLLSAGAGTWSLGLGLLMPVLDFGRTEARVDQAKSLNEQALITWQNSLQTAYREVRDALVNLNEYSLSEAAEQRRLESSTKALTVAQKRYAAGYASYLEVLDAQRSNNEAQISLVSTRLARLTSSIELFKALGGGWQAPAQTAQAPAR